MYYKLSDDELKYLKRISEITHTDYEIKGDMFPMDSFYSLIIDVICEIDGKQEIIDNLENKLQNKAELDIDPYEFYGVNEKDFH